MTKRKAPEDLIQRGRPTKYRAEYAVVAEKLCAKFAYTDVQLAEWFEVGVRTLFEWRLKHPEFAQACRLGKEETDDHIERMTAQHIGGYYVTVEELDKFGVVHKLQKWIPGNAHAGVKWLSARRPGVYRDQKDVKHTLSMDDAFLRFLDQMDEQAKLDRADKAKVIEHVADAPDMQTGERTGQAIELEAQFSESMSAGEQRGNEITAGHGAACTSLSPAAPVGMLDTLGVEGDDERDM